MAEAGGQEKTESPTQKKRDDARKEGQVALSREVSSAALLGTYTLFFLLAGTQALSMMEGLWVHFFQQVGQTELTAATLWQTMSYVVGAVTPMIAMLFVVAFIIALLMPMLQVGIMINPLKAEAGRLNPLSGIKRIFGTQGLAELLKGLFKMSVIGYITYSSLEREVVPLLALSTLPIHEIFIYNFKLLATLFWKVAVALAILAVFDYLFQRWSHEQRIRMTRQEVRDELKQTEGDPQLRSRVRQVQREMSQARMMESVPKADVVVANPTHYSVALLYDREVMQAPRVVAKGADFLALRIRRVAEENEVPIVENRQIARELYARVEIGQEIPEEFFRAVAEVLAYVYRLKGKMADSAG